MTPAQQSVLDIGRILVQEGQDREWHSPAAIAAIAARAGVTLTADEVAKSIDSVMRPGQYKTFFVSFHIERARRPKLQYYFFPRGLN